MIFKTKVLKSLMQTAYKGHGLYVANQEGNIILGSGWWFLSIEESVFPKKAKAALVELIGQLPAAGEAFRCTSAGNQMELPVFDILEEVKKVDWNNTYVKKAVLIEAPLGYYRPYQSEQHTVYLNECITDLMNGDVEAGEDNVISGPCKISPEDVKVFMATDSCLIAVWQIASHEDDENGNERAKFMNKLRDLDLPVR